MIFACFAICLLFGFWKRNALRFSQSATTVLGILGTFIGIGLGLIEFDTNNIEKSVPPLLEGLKTAFLTSITGITATLFTRTCDSVVFPIFRKTRRAEGATVQTLANLLQDQIDAHKESHTETLAAVQTLGGLLQEQGETEKENHKRTLESLESIRSSVSGEGDTSMLTQIQKLRTTFTDKQDDLIKEFRDFAEKMAMAFREGLIESLRDVIENFNEKLTTQFGENFKQLNEAVGKLVDWQDKYAEQTEAMIAQFETTISAIEQVRDSIAQIAERSHAITEAAEKLEPILEAIQKQKEGLEGDLAKFAEISKEAGELLPTLDAKINELTENFSESVRESIEANRESLNEQKIFTQTVIAEFSELGNMASNTIEKVGESYEKNVELMRTYMEDAESQQKELVSNLAEQLDSQVKDTFTKTEQEIIRLSQEGARNTEARMQAIDVGLGEELEKALNALSDRLASISDKFASDYDPLTEKLNHVLDIARGADSNA